MSVANGKLSATSIRTAASVDKRLRYAYMTAMVGFGLVLAVFTVAAFRFPTAETATAAVGTVTTAVGTLVGVFLGVQVGLGHCEQIEEARRQADARTTAFAAALTPQQADLVLRSIGL